VGRGYNLSYKEYNSKKFKLCQACKPKITPITALHPKGCLEIGFLASVTSNNENICV